MTRRSGRTGIQVLSGSLLGVALLAGVNVLAQAPAVTPALRSEGVYGDWRVRDIEALYDLGRYRFQLGYGYLHSDAVAAFGGRDSPQDTASLDDDLARGQALLEASLVNAPAHAPTWTALAWTAFLRDDRPGAVAALETSRRLAPYSATEAPLRVALDLALAETAGTGVGQDVPGITAHARDLELIRRFDRGYYRALVELHPSLAANGDEPGRR